MRDSFAWLPAEAERRYRIWAAVSRGRQDRVIPADAPKQREVCLRYGLRMHQLRRIVERQRRWDRFLRKVGNDPQLRANPQATKDVLCDCLRRCRNITEEAVEDFRRSMGHQVLAGIPSRFGWGRIARRLRVLGQLELSRSPMNRFRKLTPELAARIRALADASPRPSLRALAASLRQEGYEVSYGTVRRCLAGPREEPGGVRPAQCLPAGPAAVACRAVQETTATREERT